MTPAIGDKFTIVRSRGEQQLVISVAVENITDKRVVFRFNDESRVWAYGFDRFAKMVAK